MLDITFKVHENNLLKLVITYQSERRTERFADVKYFYNSDFIKIVSAACPDVHGSVLYLQGTSTNEDDNVLRFSDVKRCKQFFEALRTCTGNLRVELQGLYRSLLLIKNDTICFNLILQEKANGFKY